MDNYIYSYYQKITEGSIVVGEWVKRVYAYVIDGIQHQCFFFDQKKADKAIRWIEAHCHHSEGELAPNKLKLELWQKANLSCIFGLVDADGNRQFREIFLVMGRKNGKTLYASAVIAYLIYSEGEYGTKVFCLAPKVEQADIVYSAFWQTVQLEKKLSEITKHRKSDIYVSKTNSSVKKIAFNAKKSDGFNPSLVICDEIASWDGQNGLRQYEVMKSGMGARKQAFMFSISTAGYVNESIYDELYKRSTRLLLGDSQESRLLPFLYTIDDVEKWNDINELRKSNPNLGVSVSVDYLIEEIKIAEGSLSKKAEFITKYCNLKQNASTAWLPAQTIQKCCCEELTLDMFRDCYCVGGIDLSQSIDLTSACIVVEKNGKLYVISHFWLPSEKIDEAIARDGLPYNLYIQRGWLSPSGENFVDYHDCFNWFRQMVEDYSIYPLKIGYDRYSAQYLVQDMKTYGFHMDDVYQGENLTPVIRETEGLLRDAKMMIGNNDLLKVHCLDSALKANTETQRVRLVKMRQMAHIDGMAALLDAMTVRQKYFAEIGAQLENKG